MCKLGTAAGASSGMMITGGGGTVRGVRGGIMLGTPSRSWFKLKGTHPELLFPVRCYQVEAFGTHLGAFLHQ